MTDHEAIERCREALDSEDMLAVASRNDWAELVYAYDSLAALLIVANPAVEQLRSLTTDEPSRQRLLELWDRIDKELNP